jgi:hypothetical protein
MEQEAYGEVSKHRDTMAESYIDVERRKTNVVMCHEHSPLELWFLFCREIKQQHMLAPINFLVCRAGLARKVHNHNLFRK